MISAREVSFELIDWQTAYDDLLPRVYHFFCYRVGSTMLAEELTAMTFENAWRGRATFDSDTGAFANWLFGIARRVLADHFRSHRSTLSLEHAQELTADFSAEENVQQMMDFARLAALLMQLPERERELVALKYGADLTNRAIAKITGLSESNVGTILQRTVQWLRAEWDKPV